MQGATVVNYINNVEKAEKIVTDIKKSDGEAFAVKADV